jgi:hypothetical protein
MDRNANTAPCVTSPPGQGVDPRNELVVQRSSVYKKQMFTNSAVTATAVILSIGSTPYFNGAHCVVRFVVVFGVDRLR